MSTGDASWSIGVLVGLPVAIVALLIIAGLWVAAKIWEPMSMDEGLRLWILRLWLPLAAALVIAISAWSFYPYSAEYHQWQPTEGTVASVDKRLIGSGDGMEEKFVVVFDGSGQQYGCDDTRCAAVREGDHLTLTCKRTWQFTGTDGYDCRFVSTEAGR